MVGGRHLCCNHLRVSTVFEDCSTGDFRNGSQKRRDSAESDHVDMAQWPSPNPDANMARLEAVEDEHFGPSKVPHSISVEVPQQGKA